MRDLERLGAPPRLLVEVKALNSARGLQGADLESDLKKLRAARNYLLETRAATPQCLLLVVATALKDAKGEDDDQREEDYQRALARLERWMGRERTLPTGLDIVLVKRH